MKNKWIDGWVTKDPQIIKNVWIYGYEKRQINGCRVGGWDDEWINEQMDE